MAVEKKRRGTVSRGYRALVAEPDDLSIIAENADAEWRRGCAWAGIALALTFGPFLALGIWWGW